jgi:hypothetical protein
MPKKKSKKTGECSYCPWIGAVTDDHIPPECLFPGIPRRELITVPACHTCNNRASKDDEYFKRAVVLRDDVSADSSVQMLLPSVLRSLGKPEARRMAAQFLQGVHEVEIKTRAGIFLGTRPAYDVDLNRLSRVPTRIVKGLFAKSRGDRLPKEYEVTKYATDGLSSAAPALKREIIHFLRTVVNSPLISVGQTFTYRNTFLNEDPNVSVWEIGFFKTVFFLSFTLPIE